MPNRQPLSIILVFALLLVACNTKHQIITPGPGSPNETVQEHPDETQRHLLLYRVEDLQSGKANPYKEIPVPSGSETLAVSFRSDGSTILLYPTIQDQLRDLFVLGVDGSSLKKIPWPPDAGGGFAYGGWLPNGQLLLVGNKVWTKNDDESNWVEQASVGFTWVTVPSPDQLVLALWGPNPEGDYSIYDVTSHQVQRRNGPFRRCAEDGGINLAWSPDGQYLAGTDCDSDATGEGMRIRILDPFHDKDHAPIEGVGLVSWLPTGRILGMRTRPELVLLGENGFEERTWPGYGYPSPSGLFILRWVYEAGKEQVFLMEVQSGKQHELNLPGRPRWTNTNEIFVIQ